MTRTEDSIVAARDMYCKCLQDSLSPFLIALFRNMFVKLPKRKRTLREFQMQLREVKNWNSHVIKEVVDEIIKEQGREYFEDLLTAILVSNAEILATIAVVKNPAKINLKIPKLEIYIHECILNAARALYKNAFLFDENVSSLQRQRHNNEFDILVKDAIQYSLHQILPIQDIIKQYITGAVQRSDSDSNGGACMFLPDDELPSPIDYPILDGAMQEFIKHGNEDEDIDPEGIDIVDPKTYDSSEEAALFLDDDEPETIDENSEPKLLEDTEHANEVEKDALKSTNGQDDDAKTFDFKGGKPRPEPQPESPPEPELELDPEPELESAELDNLLIDISDDESRFADHSTRGGDGIFVEETEDNVNGNIDGGNHIPKTLNVMSKKTVTEPRRVRDTIVEEAVDAQAPAQGEELSTMMLCGLNKDLPNEPCDTKLQSRPESEEDDLSLYGLSDGNTNWSDDDDNDFAYTDDEFLSSNGETDENDGEDIDTMINRIRSAAKDSETKEIKIPRVAAKEDSPADVVSRSFEIDIGDYDNFDGTKDIPPEDIKMIHVDEKTPPKRKSRKSRKSHKRKSIVLFPDAASADECVQI